MDTPPTRHSERARNNRNTSPFGTLDLVLTNGEHLGVDYTHITRRRYIPGDQPGGERIELTLLDDQVTIRGSANLFAIYKQLQAKSLSTLASSETLRIESADLLGQMLFAPPRPSARRSARRQNPDGFLQRDLSVGFGLREFADLMP